MEQLEETLKKKYARENWEKILSETFPLFNQFIQDKTIETTNIQSLKQFGELILTDNKKFAVFDGIVENSINNNIVNNELSSFVAKHQFNGAIGMLYNEENSMYRLLFIQQKITRKLDIGEIDIYSKRGFFILGTTESTKTASDRLIKLAKCETIELTDIIEAFSVEKLNKQFYNELSNWYFWAIKNVTFPNQPTIKDSINKNISIEELVYEHNAKNIIQLLTRILFVWFVKQKKLIPNELFEVNKLQSILTEFVPYRKSKNCSNYYKAILQNLFFATLNCPIDLDEQIRGFNKKINVNYSMCYENCFKNPNDFLDLINSVVPFLNDGLFECLDQKTNNIYIDGFSDELPITEQLIVPDYLFFGNEEKTTLNNKNKKSVKGLINILNSYKFTIYENSPVDEEVALDPELLGKVFENLLASYNPETKTTARKQTGSFYTPREIVDYMVDESLKASIANSISEKLDVYDEKNIKMNLDILFAYTDTKHSFNEKEINIIINIISELKILDPACGSGAFPMGVLHKLVFILEKLDINNEKWKAIQKTKHTQETEYCKQRINEIENVFRNPNYARKLFLMEYCIYGVDIQPLAIQISKLRFFISLMVEQKSNNSKENFGIYPLPNFEFKFIIANTLIGIKK